MKKIAALTSALLISACAPQTNVGADTDPFEARDPIRPFNEAIFSFNLGADEYVIHPISRGYHELPGWFRYGSGNFLSNLSEPLNGINSLLQADFQSFGTSLFRFILNTTFGLGGIRDFAGENGLAENDTHFNDTLRSYGVGTGPYVVLPLLGPSSLRGTVGFAGDWVSDPVGYFISTPASIGQSAAQGIVDRDDNDEIVQQLYYDAIDPYTATRATYLQHEMRGSKENGKEATGTPSVK